MCIGQPSAHTKLICIVVMDYISRLGRVSIVSEPWLLRCVCSRWSRSTLQSLLLLGFTEIGLSHVLELISVNGEDLGADFRVAALVTGMRSGLELLSASAYLEQAAFILAHFCSFKSCF